MIKETNNLVVIKHIPHSSIELPNGFLDDIEISEAEFNRYNLKMSDVAVDELFTDIQGIELKAKYSRLFCDVERFKDNNLEVMAKLGQGYNYTNFYDGKSFGKAKKHHERWDKVIEDYYDEWHRNLDETVTKEINKGRDVLILDIHSYSDDLANHLGKKGPYPDVCIGFNDMCFSKEILNQIIDEVERKGLTYAFNYPYSGSMIPNVILSGGVKGNVYSFMLEVNKRLYL